MNAKKIFQRNRIINMLNKFYSSKILHLFYTPNMLSNQYKFYKIKSLNPFYHLGIYIVVGLIFITTFFRGIEHRFDQTIAPDAYGRIVAGYSALLTEKILGVGGFAIHEPIVNNFYSKGLTLDQNILKNLELNGENT